MAVGDIQDLTQKISKLTEEMNNVRSSSQSEKEDIKKFYSKISEIVNNPNPASVLNENKKENKDFFNSGKKKKENKKENLRCTNPKKL